MVEQERKIEDENRSFVAYSGTTLQNFLRGAYTSVDGKVLFDKNRNPFHHFPGVYFTHEFRQTFKATASVAYLTDDNPVIMEGALDNKYKSYKRLPSDIAFPVYTLWVPTKNTDRIKLLNGMFRSELADMDELEEAIRSFEPINPLSILDN